MRLQLKSLNQMKINRKKLPVKYALEIYAESAGYPSHTDLQYVLLTWLDEAELLDKDFTAQQVWPAFSGCLGVLSELTSFLDFLCEETDQSADFAVWLERTPTNTYRLHNHIWQ